MKEEFTHILKSHIDINGRIDVHDFTYDLAKDGFYIATKGNDWITVERTSGPHKGLKYTFTRLFFTRTQSNGKYEVSKDLYRLVGKNNNISIVDMEILGDYFVVPQDMIDWALKNKIK